MWADGCQSGPGVVVNSIGTYSEAIFANRVVAVSMYTVSYDVYTVLWLRVTKLCLHILFFLTDWS